jgi:hypothetical protein
VSAAEPKIARHNRRAKRKKGKVVGLRDERKVCSRCGQRRALFWQRAIEPRISDRERANRRRPRADHEHQLCRECYRALSDAGVIDRRRLDDRRRAPGLGPGGIDRRSGHDRRHAT